MKILLINYGLWQCMEGTDTDVNRDQRDLEKIELSVKSNCVGYIRTATLKQQLYWMKLDDLQSMQNYLNAINTIVQELAYLDREVYMRT